MQREACHRTRHITQGIHLFVGGNHTLARGYDGSPHRRHQLAELFARNAGSHPNALELIDGTARVSQAPPGHHWNLHPEGGDEGSEDQTNFVANSTGAVFVDRCGFVGKVLPIQNFSRTDHGTGEVGGLFRVHPVDADGHHPRRHLIIFDGPIDE